MDEKETFKCSSWKQGQKITIVAEHILIFSMVLLYCWLLQDS